ncbi:hypothetical protein [Acanthopleuribacter pedis]|uniref:Uncharacterized protein n=1 Tax=Acanthopleuribacter pedis TaxID=442870 RepID=A0A8J7QRG1_9BACT|nr:hypothetical protein [Acanthopleuribacter pedis]MBO1322855.1 hypothetical protein [Acanthopleuribacter pedis]
MSEDKNLITQNEIDELFKIHELIADQEDAEKSLSLVEEIKGAILDSGKLTLKEWKSLRERIREIEVLIPAIDMIISLKDPRTTAKKS